MIQVTGIVAADNTNVLNGTDLQSAPGPGVVIVWCASSAADTRVTFTAPPRVAMRNVLVHLRTNGVPLCSDDSPVAIAVSGGEQIALQVDITAAATVGYVVKFIPQSEL